MAGKDTISLSEEQTRFLRQYAQRLIPGQAGEHASVAQIVRDVCGLQAQNMNAVALAVRARSAGLTSADVDLAREQERSVARMWGQRGTLHLLATEDLGWLLPLFGPVFIAGSRTRRLELGLDDEMCARGTHLLRDILASQGALTRDELVEQLAMRGMRLEGQARPHLIGYAAMQGILCLGPDRGAKPTYVLLDDWIDRANLISLSREVACEELARRYLAAYSPTTPDDMVAWSGLPVGEIRTAWRCIQEELVEVDINEQPAWMLKEHLARLEEFSTDTLVVRLLADFDTYLLGYRSRDLIVEPRYAKRINAGGGMIRPALLVNGQVVGTWKSTQRKIQLEVIVEPFEHLSPGIQPLLEAEAMDMARFLGLQSSVVTALS